MATASAKRMTKGAVSTEPAAVAATPAKPVDPGTYDLLPLKAVAASPKNARKVFDQGELEGLAATIREAGIVQPLIVRPVASDDMSQWRGAKYELIAGERRFRAAAIAGLTHVPCVIRTLDDRQAMLARALENYQRKELNAIEEGSEFSMLCTPVDAGGAGYTQHGLAAELGCTQGHIANRIRLLSLPEPWRGKVISGEISAGAAREILRVTHDPKLAKALELDMKDDSWSWEEVHTVDQWKDAVDHFLMHGLERMVGKRWCSRLGRDVPYFRPTEAEREKLGIVTVAVDGKEFDVATNTKLWEELQTKHEQTFTDKQEAKAAKKEKAATEVSPEVARHNARMRAEQLAKRVENFRVDWLRLLIAKRLPGNHTVMTRLVLCSIAGGDAGGAEWNRLARFGELLARSTPGMKRKADVHRDVWVDIRELSDRKLADLSRDLVIDWFVDADGEPVDAVPYRIVDDLAEELKIDLAEEWQCHQAGALTERYWNLHDKAQLEKLSKELDVFQKPSSSKSEMVKQLLGWGQLKLPKELATKAAKAGKRN